MNIINQNTLPIYLLVIITCTSIIFYKKLYNEIIIGSIKDEVNQYLNYNNLDDNDKEDIKNKINNTEIFKSNSILINIILNVFLFIFIAVFFYDLCTNINIKSNNIIPKIIAKILLFLFVILFPLIIIITNNIENDNLEFINKLNISKDYNTETNSLFKKKGENIKNGILLSISIFLIYYLFLFSIKNGGIITNLSLQDNFIYYENIYILFFLVLFFFSIIIAITNKIKITQKVVEEINNKYKKYKEADTEINILYDENEDYKINNNYLLNIFYVIIIISVFVYFYLNHFKNKKIDLINQLLINKSKWWEKIIYFFDYKVFVLFLLLLLIGIVPTKKVEETKRVEEETKRVEEEVKKLEKKENLYIVIPVSIAILVAGIFIWRAKKK